MRQKSHDGILLVISGLLILGPAFGISVNKTLPEFNFSQKYFGVTFFPPLHINDVEIMYSETNILQLLNTVTTRFLKLVVSTLRINDPLEHTVVARIPIIAAKYNVRLQLTNQSNQSVVAGGQDFIEGHRGVQLYLAYEVKSTGESKNTTEPLLVTSFEVIKAIADKANGIYTSTVNHLVTNVNHMLNYNMIDILKKHLINVKWEISKGVYKYKIGVRVHIYYCGEASSGVEYFLNKILPLLDVVIFESIPDPEAVSCGVTLAAQCTLQKFNKCKKKLERLFPHLEVEFSTTWLTAGNSTDDSISNMVQFWKEMNIWAVRSNTTVIMYDAFNDPGFGKIEEWWTIEQSNPRKAFTIKERWTAISPTSSAQNNTVSTSFNKCVKFREFNETVQNSRNTTGKDVQFSNTYFGVEFSPYVKKKDHRNTYDKDDIVALIEKISTRFTNILAEEITEEDLEEDVSISHVPVAAAMKNNNSAVKSRAEGRMSQDIVQVFLRYQLETPEQVHAMRLSEKAVVPFDIAKRVADKANAIFPGTVKYLLLQVEELSVSKIGRVLRQLEYAGQQRGTFTYELGLLLPVSTCDVKGILHSNPKEVTRIIKQIPLALFYYRPDNVGRDGGVEPFYNRWTTIFSICSKLVKDINSQVKGGFQIGWPDTNPRGQRNVTALVWFWEKMNRWAVETNNTVFMESVFDIPFRKYLGGWWKFVEEKPCYESTQEYKFVEKVMEKDDPSPSISEVVNLPFQDGHALLEGNKTNFLLAGKYNLSCEHPPDQIVFSRQNLCVFFYPYVKNDILVNGYSEEDTKSFLNIVQTRFSKLFLFPVDEHSRSLRYSGDQTAKIAAKMNSARKRNLENATITENLQVFVSFRFEPLNSSDGALRESIDFAVDLAEEANAISENTEPYILLEHHMPFTDSVLWKEAEERIKYFRNKTQQRTNQTSAHDIKIGGLIVGEYCDSKEYFATVTQYLLPHLQLIVVKYVPHTYLVSSGVDTAFREIIQTFEVCKSKIGKIFPNLKVGLYTSWEDTETTRKSNPVNLLQFWRKINDYAVGNDTLVLLADAFDRPDKGVDAGWWSLVAETNRNGSEVLYTLQEKSQVFRQIELGKITPVEKNGKSETVPGVLAIVSTITGVFLFIVCGVAFVIMQKNHREAAATQRRLTEGEFQILFEGMRNNALENSAGERSQECFLENATCLVKRFGYDTSLEILKETFLIDESFKLGSGAFGTVCLSHICMDGKEIPAAVKRVDPAASPETFICSLKALLSEVKVLTFLGDHENVVKLLAVHTADICKGEIYVFLELCALGSLKKYLGALLNRAYGFGNEDYLDLLNEGPQKSKSEEDLEVSQLLAQWSLHIANGMKFLASKHIVHADLVTRNVLLDRNKVAKICDFGLSQRMYNYASYVKSKQEALPWRWMSPESLRRFQFNEKTDVWAYGVTLWEVYTLGEVPYVGLVWDQTFFYRLEEGLRPREPVHDPPGKYNEKDMYQLMLKCWDIEPTRRPSFEEVISMLLHKT